MSEKDTLILINAVPCVVGALFVAVRFFYQAFVLKINADAFNAQITKLVTANNTDRAIKLCGAAPSALLSLVTVKLLKESQEKYFDTGTFREESGRIIDGATGRFALMNFVGLSGMAISTYLFYRSGTMHHKAFLIPLGINAYLNLSTFVGARALKITV
ncbi:hypothetical protein KJ865_15195, partial [Myxococcota bacterium]|nr:hypothetical protein [Myxococcota bacterium]